MTTWRQTFRYTFFDQAGWIGLMVGWFPMVLNGISEFMPDVADAMMKWFVVLVLFPLYLYVFVELAWQKRRERRESARRR